FTIPPKFAKTLISFLQLAPSVRNKKIYDPFCGSGTIIQFGHMLGYTVYGSDIDNNYIKGTRKNIEFTSELLEDPIPQKILIENIFQSDISDVHKHLSSESLDGIVSEPILIPISEELPDTEKIDDYLDSTVIPIYKKFMEQAYLLLKPGKKLAFVSPIIKTSDNRRLNLPINIMAEKIGFKTIQLLSTDHLPEKTVEPENSSFELHRTKFKSIFDGSSKRILREFFLLVKPKTGIKNKAKKKKYNN
ncbi:MAG: TRM11 family SAM-dependent methyltransferase, partial [Promethearchaeota archaeon]